eukprot:g2770.t1
MPEFMPSKASPNDGLDAAAKLLRAEQREAGDDFEEIVDGAPVGDHGEFEDIVDAEQGTYLEDGTCVVTGEISDGGSDEDFVIDGRGAGFTQSPSDAPFDEIVGALEDIVVSDGFQKTMTDFCSAHCSVFEESEENKLEYMEIFGKWTKTIETYLETYLKLQIPNFHMADFLGMLGERPKIEHEIVEEVMPTFLRVLELLLSVNDFETFKSLMLSAKTDASGSKACGLEISCQRAKIHLDEEEDGEVRPELDFAICGKTKR